MSLRSRFYRFQIRLNSNPVYRSTKILNEKDRKKIRYVILIQFILSIFDLVGVGLIGAIGALAVSGVEGRVPGNRLSALLNFLNIDNDSLQFQVAILGIMASSFLILRTLASVFFTRKIIFFLSRRGAVISSNLISKLLRLDLLTLQKRSNQETLFAVTTGVGTVTLGILSVLINLISDVLLLFVLLFGLFLVEPLMSLFTFISFTAVGVFLYRFLHVKARKLGFVNANLNIDSNEKILEILGSYRESIVRGRRHYYATEIGKLRFRLADTMAEQTFMPNISKYVIEVTFILGLMGLGAFQFLLQDANRAVAVISVFLAASTRIAPSVLRLQQGVILIKNNIGSAKRTLDLISQLERESPFDSMIQASNLDFAHSGFIPEIKIRNVNFRYPNSKSLNLQNINLEIAAGKTVAILGLSGVGKTTLIDVLLGVIKPDSGEIKISNFSPLESIEKWPGAISYVPQDVLITNGSIRDNVTLGYSANSFSDEWIWSCLKLAKLDDLVKSFDKGLETQLQDRGSRLSGGQRQRLGIARAFLTSPKLLVLDEATSSLDSQTENELSESFNSIKGDVTIVMIAHRLSSVKNADIVIYIESGKIRATGSFDEVKLKVADFNNQIKLMGL